MLSLWIAYFAVWLGLLCYVLRLAVRQRHLEQAVRRWQQEQ